MWGVQLQEFDLLKVRVLNLVQEMGKFDAGVLNVDVSLKRSNSPKEVFLYFTK